MVGPGLEAHTDPPAIRAGETARVGPGGPASEQDVLVEDRPTSKTLKRKSRTRAFRSTVAGPTGGLPGTSPRTKTTGVGKTTFADNIGQSSFFTIIEPRTNGWSRRVLAVPIRSFLTGT